VLDFLYSNIIFLKLDIWVSFDFPFEIIEQGLEKRSVMSTTNNLKFVVFLQIKQPNALFLTNYF
jgi:hypothetical protein